MQSLPPDLSENKPDDEPAVFVADDGALRIRDPLCSTRWRKPFPHELPRTPMWRIGGFRDEG